MDDCKRRISASILFLVTTSPALVVLRSPRLNIDPIVLDRHSCLHRGDYDSLCRKYSLSLGSGAILTNRPATAGVARNLGRPLLVIIHARGWYKPCDDEKKLVRGELYPYSSTVSAGFDRSRRTQRVTRSTANCCTAPSRQRAVLAVTTHKRDAS
ncbi:hypothetical protein LSAT2_029216 [Lamellibrachia satsuma]|nr:hypothetical protein LSAT2_029216 [Lamellibrachia satsuma]